MNAYLNADKKNEYDICFDVHKTDKRLNECAFAINKKLT